MPDKRKRFQEFERYITICLAVASIIFFAFLAVAGSGNIGLKVVYALLAIGICGYCLWLLYKRQELLRRRSLWMSIWAIAIIVCILAAVVLNFPSPNLYG